MARKKITMSQVQALIAQVQLSQDTMRLMEIARDETQLKEVRAAACIAALPFHHTPISPIEPDEED